jgi:tRNA A37 threonylcarbamoyladenosine synthetase subunit TsaC/SUA5/YrdC
VSGVNPGRETGDLLPAVRAIVDLDAIASNYRLLAARVAPRPVFAVVKADAYGHGAAAVAVRLSREGADRFAVASPEEGAVLRRAGVPVAAPSANRFGQLSPTTAEHVRKSMGEAVDLILDGGPTSVGIESVVLSLAGDRPVLLRPGVIPVTELEALIGPVESASLSQTGSQTGPMTGAHASPGMCARHYQPATPLMLLGAADVAIDGIAGKLVEPTAGRDVDTRFFPLPGQRKRKARKQDDGAFRADKSKRVAGLCAGAANGRRNRAARTANTATRPTSSPPLAPPRRAPAPSASNSLPLAAPMPAASAAAFHHCS